MRKLKVLVIPSDVIGGVGEFRSIKPHLYLEKMFPNEFHVDILTNVDFSNIKLLKQYDIVHYHKYLGTFEDTEKNVELLESNGIVTVMDIDDYWSPDSRHPMYNTIQKSNLNKKVAENLRNARNITTTTKIFADVIKNLNTNVFVIENGIDGSEEQFLPKPTKSKKIRIGWVGGSSHKADLEPLRDNINKLMSTSLKDKIQFVVCGFDLKGTVEEHNLTTGEKKSRPMLPTETSWFEYEKIFTNNYSTVSPEYKAHLLKFTKEEFPGVENESYRRVWTKPITTYATGYNECDIVLAPLADSLFNSCKSQLKVVEAGFHKKPIIAQDFGPYQIDLINSFSKGGVYSDSANSLMVKSVNNKTDWFKYMKKLVEDEVFRNKLANNLHEEITGKYDLKVLSLKRKQFYFDLVENKSKLKLIDNKLYLVK